MKLLLIVFIVLSVLELCLWSKPLWRFRKGYAALVLLLQLAGALVLLVAHPRVWTGLIVFFSLYRCFNLSRILKGRMHDMYLRQATFKTALVLLISQVVIIATLTVSSPSRWYVLSILQLALAVVLLSSTVRHIRTTREPLLSRSYTDKNLPTLSVAIPARNETDDLELCLRSLLANNYPKLEVLVLDDCSSNAKTPDIIRQFAHDGVRFISGVEADATWLAKNWAYERLSEEANGELLLFCGVDTRFAPDALRMLVGTLLEKQKSMLSVLPHNVESSVASQLVQPIRYGWELGLPRRLFQRPPVLSTCWLIKKSLLGSAGGFRAVSRSIVPESYFARTAAVHDGYSFIRSNIVSSHKSFGEQRATAVRTRYPQLHRRPELVAFLSLAELLGIVLSLLLLALGASDGELLPAVLSGAAYILLSAAWVLICTMTYGRFTLLSLISFPLAILLDVYLMHRSMVKYEFSEVVWKGRNVCIPVMHVVPRLPNMREARHGNT